MATTFRPSHALDLVQKNLGLLGDLPGTFIGTGFNLIARPDKQNNNPFFLELNATQEILEFTNIGGGHPKPGVCPIRPQSSRHPLSAARRRLRDAHRDSSGTWIVAPRASHGSGRSCDLATRL